MTAGSRPAVDTFLYSAQDVVGHGCSVEVTVEVTVTVAVAADPVDPTDPTDPSDIDDDGIGNGGSGGYDGSGDVGSGYDGGSLARTGSDPGGLVAVAAVLLAIGGGPVALAVLRRRPAV